MNDSIKFTHDSPVGAYSTDDTGTLVAITRSYTDEIVAVVRDEDGNYITAPLGDIQYVAAESAE